VPRRHPREARRHAQPPAPVVADVVRDGEEEARRGDAQVEQLEDVGLVLEQQLLADDRQVDHATFAAGQQVGPRRPHPGDAVGLDDAGLVLQAAEGRDGQPRGREQPEDRVELRLRFEADTQRHPSPSARRTSRHDPSARVPSASSSR
jgi:hypothetical protein